MNHKFRLAISAASFFVVLSGSLIALNNLSLSSPSQYAQAAADPNAPTNPAVKLPGSTTTGTGGTGTGTTSNTGTGGPTVVTPTAPAVNNVGLLDGVANGGETPVTPTTPTTPSTTTTPANPTPAAVINPAPTTTKVVSDTQQAAANSNSTVRTGGLATTGLILIAAIGVGIYYYQKTHMQSKFALKMSEKKIGGRK